jgi:hypothetical protein
MNAPDQFLLPDIQFIANRRRVAIHRSACVTCCTQA